MAGAPPAGLVRRRPHVTLLVLVGLAALGVERPRGLGDVREIRHWSYDDYTRVVVELTREAPVEIGRLPADAGAARPERLYLDIEGIWVGRSYDEAIAVEDGLLHGIRVGQNTKTRTRVVIDLERYQRHRFLKLTTPDRLVVDVYAGVSTEADPDAHGDPLSRLPVGIRPVRTVVIDPGHGGRDPGAVGVGGLREKDVTLALAKRLQANLEARGFAVVSTRTSDRTVGLEERTAIAEAARADLFLSLHANAAERAAAHGIETYHLDLDYERHTWTVASRENGIPRNRVDELQRTIAGLRVSETLPHSRRLARVVHEEIVSGVAGRYGRVTDLGVKRGPFYVLFLADMPSILLEVGFVSNRSEARRLRDDRYLDLLAERIAAGLERYRDTSRVAEQRRG